MTNCPAMRSETGNAKVHSIRKEALCSEQFVSASSSAGSRLSSIARCATPNLECGPIWSPRRVYAAGGLHSGRRDRESDDGEGAEFVGDPHHVGDLAVDDGEEVDDPQADVPSGRFRDAGTGGQRTGVGALQCESDGGLVAVVNVVQDLAARLADGCPATAVSCRS